MEIFRFTSIMPPTPEQDMLPVDLWLICKCLEPGLLEVNNSGSLETLTSAMVAVVFGTWFGLDPLVHPALTAATMEMLPKLLLMSRQLLLKSLIWSKRTVVTFL